MSAPQGKSLYRRRNKRPFQYSELYQGWRTAKMAGNEGLADEYARKHHSRFVLNAERLFGPLLGPVDDGGTIESVSASYHEPIRARPDRWRAA